MVKTYTLEDLKKELASKEPFNHGNEGSVYLLDSRLVAKVSGDRGIVIPGREVTRHNVNSTANSLLDRLPYENGDVSVRFLDVYQSFREGKMSYAIMPFAEGHPYGRAIFRIGERETELDDFALKNGVALDRIQDNLYVSGSQGDTKITIIESLGLTPEFLKRIEQLNSDGRKDTLERLARTYLVGGLHSQPTVSLENSSAAGFGFSWYMGEQAYKKNKAKIEGERRGDDTGVIVKTREELERARRVFGPQFVPESLDLEEGKNLDNYGINPEVFHQFRSFVDRLKSKID